MLFVNDAYGKGIHDVFLEEFRSPFVASESFSDSQTDFRTSLAKINAQKPDLLVLIARKESSLILKQAKELGLQVPVITSESFKNPDFVQAAGDSAEGVYTVYFSPSTSDAGFKQRFLEANNKEPSTFAEYGYDAVMAVYHAMKKAGTDPIAIKNALYSVEFDGATGHVRFDSKGEVTGKTFIIYQVQNGQFKEIRAG